MSGRPPNTRRLLVRDGENGVAATICMMAAGIQGISPEHILSPIRPHRHISENQLVEALRAEAFIVHFQPKIGCHNDELVGFECLARWPQPDGGMIPPARPMDTRAATIWDGFSREIGR